MFLILPGVPENTAWYLELGIAAGALTALSIIWQKAIRPLAHVTWAALLSAPQIATGIDEIKALVEGDVLTRLDAGAKRFDDLEGLMDAHGRRLDSHDEALAALYEAIGTSMR